MTDGSTFTVKSVYLNNTTYAFYTMLNGSSYSKKFADGDWMKASFYGVTLPRRKAYIGKGLDNGRPVAAQCRQRVEEHLLADGFERFRTVGHEHSRLRGA